MTMRLVVVKQKARERERVRRWHYRDVYNTSGIVYWTAHEPQAGMWCVDWAVGLRDEVI